MNNIANMKWHGLYLTVAAFWLITLPIKSFGEHCREDTWNQALKSQAEVEHWYNKKALSFNQLLELIASRYFCIRNFLNKRLPVSGNQANEPYTTK